MCKLCEFAKSDATFGAEMMQVSLRDLDRLIRTKQKSPGKLSVFTNVPTWAAAKFGFALLEPLAAFPNPDAYYQAVYVDGEKLRNDWHTGWVRAIGFLPGGGVILYMRAVEHERANPSAEDFLYFYLVEFKPGELQFEYAPPKFFIRADNVRKEGINLLTNAKAEHAFSFTFSHLAIDTSAMRADAVKESAFLREVLRRGPAEEKGKPGVGAKSDFEKYTITTMHYAPHPLLMRGFRQMGYENRFDLQLAVPEFLDEHFKALRASSPQSFRQETPQQKSEPGT